MDIQEKDSDFVTRVAHIDVISDVKVKIGSQVSLGDIVALSGKNGPMPAPHVHYEHLTPKLVNKKIKLKQLDPRIGHLKGDRK